MRNLEKDDTENPVYKTRFTEDKISFGFPEALTKPMKQQLMEATQPIGGAKFKVQENDKQFMDENKQLQLPSSSTIQAAAYWPKKEYLIVSFKSGHTYSYDKVPLITVMIWEQVTSAGSWFYYNIRMNYPYKKLG